MAAVLVVAGVAALLTTAQAPAAAQQEAGGSASRSTRDAPLPDALKNIAEPTYDYIVVGSGPGGGVVGSMLARKGFKVLLFEAGKNTTNNTIYTTPLRHPEAVEDPLTALNYWVRLNENRTHELYPRAQGLGGCTLHHALITSPLPTSEDFELIRRETGDDSWAIDNMHEFWRGMTNV